jgi:hypothetical protein
MLYKHVIALAVMGTAFAVSGCGESSKGTSTASQATIAVATGSTGARVTVAEKPGKQLSRSELVAQGDAICYRLNAKRSAITLSRPGDYERLVPPLAAYELAGATEMGRLVPPASMASDWQKMVAGSRTIANATGRFRTYAEANAGKLAHAIDLVLGKGIDELTHAAKHAGFKECSHFA